MERNVRIGWLLDFYGSMLTSKQRRVLELRWNDDLSLAEIGEAMGMSRQAVNDAAGRGEDRLNRMEERLGLLGRHMEVGRKLDACLREARSAGADGPDARTVALLQLLEDAVRTWEE